MMKEPAALKPGIDKAVEAVVEEIKKISKPTKGKKEISQVATISANNDKLIGDLVADAVEKVREASGAFGFNAESEEYEDPMAAGIIDPTKVARTALEDASNIAGLMITTECLVTEAPEKKEKAVAPAPPEEY